MQEMFQTSGEFGWVCLALSVPAGEGVASHVKLTASPTRREANAQRIIGS